MTAALAYLIVRSTRNKFVTQIARVRNPRYAVAVLLGLGYFWMVFFNSSGSGSRGTSPVVSETFGVMLPIILLVVAAYTWIFGADRSALAFTQAEVSLLFPAPVSRRALIIYKLARAQAAVLTSTLIWLILFRRGDSAVERALGYWVCLSIISLHRLGVALVRASQLEHRGKGIRRSLPAVLLFLLVCAAVAFGIMTTFRGARGSISEPGDFMRLLTTAFSTPPASWALLPFRIAVAPALTPAETAWGSAMLAALLLLGAHFWWVLRTDSAFEEAAAEASAAQAKRIADLRSRGISGATISTKGVRRTIPLRAVGIPAVAILWKNVLWLVRTGQVRMLVGLPVVAAVAALVFAGRSPGAEYFIIISCLMMAALVVVFAPMTMRNDLRGDLARLPMLKTLPLRGWQIMLAEVASSATPTAALQFLLVWDALLAMSFVPKDMLPPEVRMGIFLGAPALCVGLNLANFTIHNGLALLFPAWVRLGETGVNGIEAVGQSMLTMLVTLLMLGVLLAVPALLGGAIYLLLQAQPIVALAASGIGSGLLLGLEAWGVIGLLGGSLERLEPMQVG